MPSPYPGMDPYLEGYLWPDVHAALANAVRQWLVPLVRPRYTVRIGVYVAYDPAPEAEIGIMYPDIEILRGVVVGSAPRLLPTRGPSSGRSGSPVSAPLTVPVLEPVEISLMTVEIRDVARDTLVTAIEVLSPVTKVGDGLATYRRKRQRLHQAGVHLLEIDLIRRGTRPLDHSRIPTVPYLVTLTRGQATTASVWPVALQDALPTVPVPLRQPDDDVELDLQAVLASVYETAAYELSIDYRQPPTPPLLADDASDWVASVLGRPD